MSEATVSTPSPAYDEMEKDRALARILLYDGQRGLRDAGETYLPRYEGEAGDSSSPGTEYGRRLRRSFLVNFYRDAVQNLVGRVFQRPLVLDEAMPRQLRELWENIDDAGTHGDVFVYYAALDALGQGVSHILVDFQRPGEEFASEDDEARAGVRPKWIHIKAHKAIEALPLLYNGRPFLQRFRASETRSVADGYDYGSVNRVREYLMGNPTLAVGEPGSYASFNVWEQGAEDQWYVVAGPLAMEPSRKAPEDQRAWFVEPPIVPLYGERIGFFQGKPSLFTLADLTSQHWQLKSNLDHIEYQANVPTMVQIGGDGKTDSLEIGAGRVVGIPEGYTLQWMEIQGAGIAHLKESIKHLEEHIRLVGKEPMLKKASGSELATVRLLNEAQTMTQAQVWAIQWLTAINRCMDLTATWLGLEAQDQDPGTKPWVSIGEDVMESLARPEAFDDVLALLANGAISAEAAAEEAIRYGILDRDFDIEADAGRRDSAPPLI